MLVRLDALPAVLTDDALVVVALLGVLMPAVAATVVTRHQAGWGGVRSLYRRLGRWRFGRWWWAALALQPVVLVATAAAYNFFVDGDGLGVEAAVRPGSVVVSLIFLIVAASGEEVGWRGLALPVMQQRYGASRASLLLGLVVATWHVPYWVLQGVVEDYGWAYIVIDYVFVVALTFQLTWLFNHAGGSVLAAVAFHVSFNLVNVTLIQVTGVVGAFVLLTVIEIGVAIAVFRTRLFPSVHAR